MAEATLASAVAPPDLESPEQSPSSNGRKRRQSDIEATETAEVESKRQRISPGKNSPTAVPNTEEGGSREYDGDQPSNDPTEEKAVDSAAEAKDNESQRRKGSVVDDKQRSKRLFGALLGNLNQPGDRASKRRRDIEERRKAELRRQDDERVEDKARRLEKLAEKRKLEQRRVDEKNMHLRHKFMLNAANFLQTKSEPKLYYRPWELRSHEEDRIKQQIREAQAQIARELEGLDRLQRSDVPQQRTEGRIPSATLSNNGQATHDGTTDNEDVEATDAMGNAERHITDKSQDEGINATPAEVPQLDRTDHQETSEFPESTRRAAGDQHEDEDDDGGHVVEGEEDTVIY